jgi:glycosyltransferase involved in cell wall biosynthesis
MQRDRLRVVHVITMLELGGAQQNTLYTVSHLNRERFEPHLVTGVGGLLDKDAVKLDIPVHFCPSLIREIQPLQDFRAYRFLKNFFRELQPDIVHTHSSKAGILGRMAARDAGVRHIVHTYHGFGFHRFQNSLMFHLYLLSERAACRRTEHLIFVSEGNRRWADELHLTNGTSVSLIRSGVETQKYRVSVKDNLIRKELGIPDHAKIVGMIACLKKQKDPLTFVEAADLVSQKVPDVYFLLIGDGELKEKLIQRVAKMKDPSRFFHLGWRRDTGQILPNMDLFVLTSLWEGLPRVIPEATLSGVPVIASNIEGNREVIFERQNGAVAEPQNSKDFADKIIQALNGHWQVDPSVRDKMESEFNIDEMVRRQEDLYLKLASRKA